LRKKRPFMLHVVFSLHFYAFVLLLMSASLLIARVSTFLGYGGIEAATVDNVLSVAMLLICTAYIYRAIGPVYESQGARRVVSAVVLVIGVAALVLGYRLALFLITLYST